MKRYITTEYFKNDYGFNAINQQVVEDDKINFFIGGASNRVNTIVGGAITKGIRDGYYTYTDADGIKLDDSKITDQTKLAEAKDATEAIKEQIATLTKFSIETGWDFLSGSFSSSIGSQSDSETIDFETSLSMIERVVREALAIYDFNTILFTSEIEISFEDENGGASKGQSGIVYSQDRPLTEAGLTNRLTDPNWTKATGGVKIEETVPNSPSQGITISIDTTSIEVEDIELTKAGI